MIELWNDPKLLPPPVHTCLGKISVADLKLLKTSINNTIRVLSMQSPIHQESALMSRFIYKFDKKFRSDIGFQNMKKVNTCLKRYLGLNLLKDVENFSAALPEDADDKYIPTRQMLEYVLVRIQTFSKIMLRICVTSKQAAIFYMHRVKRGESHWMSLMPYALLCRIWSMSKVLLEHACDCYSILYPLCDKLIEKGVQFLPKDYELPVDLRKWIDLPDLDMLGKFNWQKQKNIEIGNILEDNEEDGFDSILEYVNTINIHEIEESSFPEGLDVRKQKDGNVVIKAVAVDCGESISRDIFKKLNSQKLDSYNHTPENVTNKFSLERFITSEEDYRNENKEKALSNHLSFMQWQALKTALVKLKESLATNRKIERKFKKIWQEKCLTYME